MSYKTNITKMQTAQGEPAPSNAESGAKAATAAAPAKDVYTTKAAASGGYKNLLEGKRVPPQYHDAIQNILLGLGTATPLSAGRTSVPEEEAIMKVPDLEGEIFRKDPERYKDMKPVLDRYIALEKMLNVQVIEIKKDLASKRGSTEEIAILWKKLDNYKEKLFECGREIDKARVYYQWEKQNKVEAAKKNNKKGKV